MYGMPGIGKTALAKRLFDHPSVSAWFEKQSWCVASQKYERQKILAEVLTQINGEFDKDKTSKMDSESLVVRIHKTLYGRRYLIVIDDVWDSNLWDDLVGCFPDDGNGSRILFTTRNKNVGPTNCDDYAVPSLSNEECWELLQKKVFGNNTCPPQLIGTGKGIAAKCWGLPLAVVVIAGILSSTDKKKNLWEEVGRNLASSVFNGGDNSSVMQILELSYKHLPQRLKPCFLYFRAFTQLKNVPVKKLMMLWISEGFVHKEEGKSAEDVAQQYLTELIDKSLVMVAKRRSDGGVKTCTLHDLLRELCFKICEYENFIKIEEKSMYSVYENGILHLVDPRFRDVTCSRSYCVQVRSLHGTLTQSPFYPGMMRLLRVLDLRCLFSHLTRVEYLVNLRYLVIYDLPAASIGSLMNLEYLRVLTEKTIRLPPSISRLIKLRYLNAYLAVYCDSFQTNNIESLSCIVIASAEDEEMLKYSPNLGKLKCVYQRGRLSSNFDLSFFSCLHSLKVVMCGSGMTEITFPRNVTKLSLYGSLSLPWEKMAIIGRLEKLEVLKLGLIPLEEEERWDARDGEIKWYTRDGEFQKLRFLKLDRLVSLTQWNVEWSGHLPVLQRLVLRHCENLEEIPSEIGEIATLQLIEVKGRCAESLVESAKLIQRQQLEMENEELKVIINTD